MSTKVYYAQNQFANEQVAILDSNYRPITDSALAGSIFLANFDQEVYILTSN
jgi:hypothetical protein